MRAEPRSERVERLVKGDVYRPPLLMAFYTSIAVFLVTNLVLLPMGFAIGSFLGLTGLNQDYPWEVWEPFVFEATVIPLFGLLPLYMIPIAKAAAHRIRHRALLWIGGSLIATWVVGGAIQELWELSPHVEPVTASRQYLILNAITLVLGIGGAAIGCAWARRTQSAFVMRKLFRQLSRSDQHDIIELVKTLPVPRST